MPNCLYLGLFFVCLTTANIRAGDYRLTVVGAVHFVVAVVATVVVVAVVQTELLAGAAVVEIGDDDDDLVELSSLGNPCDE